jgi:hypothetical protein
MPDLAQQIARQQAELEALQQEYATRQSTLADLNRQKTELKDSFSKSMPTSGP